MMICKNCMKPLSNPKAKFCSDKCRMTFNRKTRTQQPEQKAPEQPKPEQVGSNTSTTLEPGSMTLCQNGQFRILKSEKQHLIDYLKQTPLAQLKAEGRFIPNWRRLQG